jgi:alpha-tubulin suppressor-like RCC1 family protein
MNNVSLPSRVSLLALAMSVLFVGMQTGCNEPPPSDDTKADVTFRISAADVETSGASGSTVSSLGVVAPAIAANFSFADVNRMQLSILQGNTPILNNIPFMQDPSSPQDWSVTVPLLPKNVQLTFKAHAFKGEVELFNGQLDQTLTGPTQNIVIIRLAPVTNGNPIRMPRIKKIYLPNEFLSEQGDNVTFSLESHLGDKMRFEITSPPNSGQFVPPTGKLTLLTTLGAFVSQYVPPLVSQDTDFTHTVKVTNEDGYSIATTFKTRVKPPSNTGARDSKVSVLFNPVITGLTAQRNGTDLTWKADVSDDGPLSNLTYAWSFTPLGTYPQTPGFAVATTNPATIQNYTVDVQGTLTLEVREGTNDATRTTLKYELVPNQFPDEVTAPAPTTGLVSITSGSAHTCVVRDNGLLRCWGSGGNGRLGYGSEQPVGDRAGALPVNAGDVAEISQVKQVSAGLAHTCAVLETGYVKCWGSNAYGQLGYGHKSDIGDGELIGGAGYVSLGGVAIKVVAGGEHSCALMDTGRVRCWGRNNAGQLGYGNSSQKPAIGDDEPAWEGGDVDLGSNLVQDISAGHSHTCALQKNGLVRCWGLGTSGQLGYGNTSTIGDGELPNSVSAIDVAGPVIRIKASGNATCALMASGTVRCWGQNNYGQNGLGDNLSSSFPAYRAAPVNDVNLGETATDITMGGEHACALLASGGVKCWGRNSMGQLGTGTTTSLSTPSADYINMASAVKIAAGGTHTCALLSTGKVRCWGDGLLGRLGYGNINNVHLPVQDVPVLPQ